MFSGEVNGVAEEGIGNEGKRCLRFVGHSFDGESRFGFLIRGEKGLLGNGDTGFLFGDFSESRAEPLGVIERDRRENADVGGDCSSGIEAAAHAGLEDDELAVAVTEVSHGKSEAELEKGRMVFPVSDEFTKFGEEGGSFVFRDIDSAHANTLTIVNKMRGGEKAGAHGDATGEGIDESAGGAFAIGACNVDYLRGVLREGEEVAQKTGRIFKPQLDPKHLGGVEPVDCFLVVHGGSGYALSFQGPRMASVSPGPCMLTKRTEPSGEKQEPANSVRFMPLRARL